MSLAYLDKKSRTAMPRPTGQSAMILGLSVEYLSARPGSDSRGKICRLPPEDNSVDNFVDKAKLTSRIMWI
jgi:hypothetical protein